MSVEKDVVAWLAEQDIGAYLVGGCVRDRLLGRPTHDLDVAVAGDGLILARRLANRFGGAYYPLDEERLTGRAILPREGDQPLVVDLARFRGPSLAADLADRDFSINALAADVHAPDDIIDQQGGLADLRAGLIRPVADNSIRSDPLRALRALRQAAQLGFSLAPETEMLIRRDGWSLAHVSDERVRDELARLLALASAAPYLFQLDDLGLLTILLPELEPLRELAQPPPHHLPALAHSLQTVQDLEELLGTFFRRPDLESLAPFAGRIDLHLSQILSDTRPRLITLKMAALLHDTGKPAARTIDEEGRVRFLGHHEAGARLTREAMRRLRFSGTEIRLGEVIVRHHMRPLLLANQKKVSSKAIYRFFRDTDGGGVDVLLHALADHQATYAPGVGGEQWARLVDLAGRMLGDYWERRARRVDPPLLVNGRDLQHAFDLDPGPLIGELLETVREAQVGDKVHTREEALALVRRTLVDRLD